MGIGRERISREVVAQVHARHADARNRHLVFEQVTAHKGEYLVTGGGTHAHEVCNGCTFHGRGCSGVHQGSVTLTVKSELLVGRARCNLKDKITG